MSEFLFIRHCETEMNARPELVGGRSTDTPPTERGRRQASAIGSYLRSIHYSPDAVYSSGALRTNTTATLALERAARSPQDIRVEPLLLEIGHGSYEGLLRKDVYTPQAIDQYALGTLDGKLPGGESVSDVQQRMWEFLVQTHDLFPEGNVLIFGHGFAIRALAGKILGQTKQEILATATDNVSLTQITTTPGGTPYVDFIGENVIEKVE